MPSDPMSVCAHEIVEEGHKKLAPIRVEDEWRKFRQGTRFKKAMEEYERANPYWRPFQTYEARFKMCLRSEVQHFGRWIGTAKGRILIRHYPVAMPTGNGMTYFPWESLSAAQVDEQARMRNLRTRTELAQRDFALILREEMRKASVHRVADILDIAIGVFSDTWGKYDPASIYQPVAGN